MVSSVCVECTFPSPVTLHISFENCTEGEEQKDLVRFWWIIITNQRVCLSSRSHCELVCDDKTNLGPDFSSRVQPDPCEK
ncbi:hypothetical protein GOP47_0002953 [Adiantum capillus-veneris]|uniref:Uncharacterized protein n=1 Tax=Adiantum capillus-veneris TaxID=13818 RepID=A0A9D4VBW7_ADICA|nr:hypothetical protein GOP47_0002953 [Adiantum capillus-veneris]